LFIVCDTFVAMSHATKDGSVIFGKNSDRHPNEAHRLLMIPRATHSAGAQVKCTYISVPQVRQTHAVLLSKPFWIWGAEMGANEHGVVIGNEAVFTKVPYDKEQGLLGMDFIRLALERAATANEALDVMIELLETYGQGGNSTCFGKFFYHNSFLIADPSQAWVFETAGQHWAAEKVQDIRSISNMLSIGDRWDRASSELVSHAISKGWCKNEQTFNFSECYSDLIYTNFGAGKHRSCRTGELLLSHQGEIDVPYAMHVLRDHGPEADENWQPGKGIVGAEVCMHASFGPVRGSQATGSMISHLASSGHTHWVTGTSAPCTSVFKPVWIDSGLPDFGPEPAGLYDAHTVWWRHENLHREILRDYAARIKVIKAERDHLEADFLARVEELAGEPFEARAAFTQNCFDEGEMNEARWLAAVIDLPIKNRRPRLDQIAWQNFDRKANRASTHQEQLTAFPIRHRE
jgi:dipeptidase